MEKRYCEACGNLMGEMSLAAWEATGGLCDECGRSLFSDDDMDATAESVQQF